MKTFVPYHLLKTIQFIAKINKKTLMTEVCLLWPIGTITVFKFVIKKNMIICTGEQYDMIRLSMRYVPFIIEKKK